MSWCSRFFVVAALYYGFQSFQRIVPRRKSTFEGKKDDYSGKLKVKKILAQGGGDWPKVVAEAALKWFFIEEQATSKPPATSFARSKSLLVSTVCVCAGLFALIWRRRVRRNQQVNRDNPHLITQAALQQFNISPEDKLKAYLSSGAGLIVTLETLLTVLELHHHYGTLHRGEFYTMESVLRATEQELIHLEIPWDDVIQIKTGVRWLHSLGRRNFTIV